MKLVPLELDLQKKHMSQLHKGRKVLLKPSFHGGAIIIHMAPMKHRRIMKAFEKSKGSKLDLSPDEIRYNEGQGVFDVIKKVAKSRIVKDIVQHPVTKKLAKKALEKIEPMAEKGLQKILEKPLGKKTASKISKKLSQKGVELIEKQLEKITTEPVKMVEPEKEMEGGKIDLKKTFKTVSKGYKKYVKPIASPLIKKGLQEGVKLGTKALTAYAPELAPITQQVSDKYGDKAVDFVMKKTGLGVKLKDDYSNFLHPQHPAMNPNSASFPDMSMKRTGYYGGSFLPSGYKLGGSFLMAGEKRRYGMGSYSYGMPLNPFIDVKDMSNDY